MEGVRVEGKTERDRTERGRERINEGGIWERLNESGNKRE
jgi:hypothetical protein